MAMDRSRSPACGQSSHRRAGCRFAYLDGALRAATGSFPRRRLRVLCDQLGRFVLAGIALCISRAPGGSDLPGLVATECSRVLFRTIHPSRPIASLVVALVRNSVVVPILRRAQQNVASIVDAVRIAVALRRV